MPPEVVPEDRQEFEHQLRAGKLLRAAVDGLGITHRAFAASSDIESGTLRRLWNKETVGPVLDVTKAGLLKTFRAETEMVADVAGIEELADETHKRIIDALVHGQSGIADWLMSKWWFQTGVQPMEDNRRSTLRTGKVNVPEFSELLNSARALGLITEKDAANPWANPVVRDAMQAWLYESVERTGRPAGLSHFVLALQIAGLRTTADGLEHLGVQCSERGIVIPAGVGVVDLSAADASLTVNQKVPPFAAVRPILQVVGAHTGRPELVTEVEALWDRIEQREATAFGMLNTLFQQSGLTHRELAYVVGVPFTSGAQANNPIYAMVSGKSERAPFRAMALGLAPDAGAVTTVDARRTQEIVEWHRLRGKRRVLPQTVILRDLWQYAAEDLELDANEFDGLLYDRGGTLKDEDVVARIEETGLRQTRDVLVRWLERRGFFSARQVMLAFCERYKFGDSGNGTAKLDKDVSSKEFSELYANAGAVMTFKLLADMLEKIDGMTAVPPGLEARHRLAHAGYLASEAGGGMSPRQRFFESIITEKHRSQRQYHQSLSHADSVRQSFHRMFSKLKDGGGDAGVLATHAQTLLGTTGELQPRLHRLFVALAAAGSYPDAVTVVCREWLNGNGDDVRVAHELLTVLRTPNAEHLVPHPLATTELNHVSLASLLRARWRTGSERNGAAWQDDCDEFAADRLAARTLRLLPGITEAELVQAADALRFEIATHAIDQIIETAPRPHTDETMARLAGIVTPLIGAEYPESRVLHAVQVSSSLYSQWCQASTRFAPPVPYSEAEQLHALLPRSIDPALLDIRHETGPIEAAEDDPEAILLADTALVQRWEAPALRLSILIRRLALASVLTPTQSQNVPADADQNQADVAVVEQPLRPEFTEQQRLLMNQIIELLFAQHGDTDELDRVCRDSNVHPTVLTTWRSIRKREETKRRMESEQGELARLRLEVVELRAAVGAPLADAERQELVRLRAQIAELEQGSDAERGEDELSELLELRARAVALQRQIDGMVDFIPPSMHAEALAELEVLRARVTELEGMPVPTADAVDSGALVDALAELERLRGRIIELEQDQPSVQDESAELIELRAEVAELREQLLAAPQAAVRVEVQHAALPRELQGAVFIRGTPLNVSQADPVVLLLDVLSAPLISAEAVQQLYGRVQGVLGAAAEMGSPLFDDLMYLQQFASAVRAGSRPAIAPVVERLVQKLQVHRPSWRPPQQPVNETVLSAQSVVQQQFVGSSDSAVDTQRVDAAERARLEAERRLASLTKTHEELTVEHERLQRETEIQIRQAIQDRDAAQREQRRLLAAHEPQKREIEALGEERDGLLAEVERLRAEIARLTGGAPTQSVTAVDSDEDGSEEQREDDPDALPVYEPHPDDDSGVDFLHLTHVVGIGEYLQHFLGPDSAGFTLAEPASESAARRIASLETLETYDLTAALHTVACCYSLQPNHPGNALVIGRIQRYRRADPLPARAKAKCFSQAVDELLLDEDVQNAVERIRREAPGHPLLALLNEDDIPVNAAASADDDDDPPPSGRPTIDDDEESGPRKKKKGKKKKKTGPRTGDDELDLVPGLREMLGDAVPDAVDEYTPNAEDEAAARAWAEEHDDN